MHQLGEQLLIVLPKLNEEGDTGLEQDVTAMTSLFRQAGSHMGSDPGTRANYNLLLEQLDRSAHQTTTARMLKSDLKDAFAICVSCHKQDKRFVRNYGVSKFRDMDEFMAVEYSYITRDYPAALTSYRNFLSSSSPDSERVRTSLDHLLVITLEIYTEPKLAHTTFTHIGKVLEDNGQPTDYVNEWIATIARLAIEPPDLQSPYSRRDIKGMDRYLTNVWPQLQSMFSWNQQMVCWIASRGQLKKMLLECSTDAEVPRLLCWLAVSDRALHYRFYDFLSRRYLEQCMREHTDHAFAKECFKEYEMLMVVSFSGSGGVYLPAAALEEIAALWSLVYGTVDASSD